jgi:general secretion pathway protein G/type IV pilus assembly protein PilA
MKKAFTLIELLIVIAIIGILAGIVLVSLTGALKKGKDSRIQADLQQVRNIAGMIMSDRGNYDELCNSSTNNDLNTSHDTYGTQLSTLSNDIKTQQGGTLTLKCYASGNDYCISAALVAKTGYYLCIDSDGNVVATSSNPCTAVTSKCK